MPTDGGVWAAHLPSLSRVGCPWPAADRDTRSPDAAGIMLFWGPPANMRLAADSVTRARAGLGRRVLHVLHCIEFLLYTA